MSASIWSPGEAISADNSVKTQAFTATPSQTLFTLTSFTYAVGTGSLLVFVSGVAQRPGVDFFETGTDSFTLSTPVAEDTIVLALAFVEISAVLDQTFVVTDYYVAAGGETLLTINNFTYTPGGNHLRVFRNGLLQELSYDYTETSSNSITFTQALDSADRITLLSNVFYTETEDGDLRGDLLGSVGSSLVGFLADGIGASTRLVEDKLRDVVSVKDFGAVGDGVTDDTAAIQAAITYCQDNLKALYFPAVDPSDYYKITATLTITKPINIIGDGAHSVTLIASGLAIGEYALDIDGTAYGTFEKMNLSGLSIRAGAGDCIHLKNVSLSKLSDVGIGYCRHGIVYEGTRCFSNRFERLHSNGSITGQGFRFTTHTGGGHHTFQDCTFGGAIGFYVDAAVAVDCVTFNSCNFEQCTTYSCQVVGTIDGLSFFGCRTEGCDGIDFVFSPGAADEVKGLVIQGCSFNASDAGGATRITLGGGAGVMRGFNITGNVVTHGANNFSAAFVTLNGDGESGFISGNFLNGTTGGGAVIVNVARSGVLICGNENLTGKLTDYGGNGTAIGLGFWNYVENTFTFSDGSGAGLTLAVNGAHYTRIGRMVFWQASIKYPVTADASAAELSGLPYTPLSGSADQGRSGAFVNSTDAAVDLGVLQKLTSGTEIKFYNRQTNVAILNSALSNKTIYMSGLYAV